MKPPLAAGPNGAVKTTFYNEFLSSLGLPFLNADLLEARTGISSIEAARMLDAIRADLIEQNVGFITETVFSDTVGVKLGLLRKAVDQGYDATLIYIRIDSELCALRIDQRVVSGGRDRIASRFERSIVLQTAHLYVAEFHDAGAVLQRDGTARVTLMFDVDNFRAV